MHRRILVDADILIYRVAAVQESVFDFGGHHILHADGAKAIAMLNERVEALLKETASDSVLMCLTGSDNYRKRVYPQYKANRAEVRRPMVLKTLRQYLEDNYECVCEDTLEGDDLIGIWATTFEHGVQNVVYSQDKDLTTIPGFHWSFDDKEVVTINQQAADLFFFEQVLTGDPTDHYKGCPGVGKKLAKDLLDEPFLWKKEVGEFKSGPRVGQEKITWVKEPTDDLWASIVSTYRKAGLNERDALQQARCARILRNNEYDFEKKEVKLWVPQ